MAKREADFPRPIVRELQDRVNGCCSNPDCNKATRGPKAGGKGALTVGDAAHITAAEAGGPRYDPSLTLEERRSVDNGIWLCKICARKIDLDIEKFPVELLRSWKQQAEAKADSLLGQRIPTENDIRERVHQIVTGEGTRYEPNLISTAVSSVVQQMRALDSRWDVVPEYRNGKETFHLNARENITLNIAMPSEKGRLVDQQLKALFAHGTPAEFDVDGLSITGSKLIESILQDAPGRAVLRAELASRHPSELFISLSPTGGGSTTLGVLAFQGEAAIGSESVAFSGTGMGGLFEVFLSFPYRQTEGAVATFNFDCRYGVLTGKPIASLPYISKALAWTEGFSGDEPLSFNFEIGGLNVWSENNFSGRRVNLDEMQRCLCFLDNLAEICRHLDSSVTFDPRMQFTNGDFDRVRHTALAIRSGGSYENEIESSRVEGDVIVSERLLGVLDDLRKPRILRCVPPSSYIDIGGSKKLVLPGINIDFEDAELVEPKRSESLLVGQNANLVWEVATKRQRVSLITKAAAGPSEAESDGMVTIGG